MTAELIKDVSGLIGNWQPRKVYHIGPNYLEDLKKFLQEKLKVPVPFFSGKKTQLEFIEGKGMGLGVKRKVGPSEELVGIMMKRDLAELSDLKLLMEQVRAAEKHYGEMILILMGTVTTDMEAKLNAFLANRASPMKISVVRK